MCVAGMAPDAKRHLVKSITLVILTLVVDTPLLRICLHITESDADSMPNQGKRFILWQHIILIHIHTHKNNIKKGINNPSTQELKDLWASLVAQRVKNLPVM